MKNFTINTIAVLSLFTLQAYNYPGQSWPSRDVPYYVNVSNGIGLSESQVLTSLDFAASTWTLQSNANVQLNFVGKTNGGSLKLDRVNNVYFAPGTSPNGPFLAEAYRWYDGTYSLIDFDSVIYEGAANWVTGDTPCPSGGIYIEDVMAHEFGHGLGLDHSEYAEATMYYNVGGYCSQKNRTLHADDIAGIEKAYPPSSGGGDNGGGGSQTPPNAPSNLSLAAKTTTSISLHWIDQSNDEDGFIIQRSTEGGSYVDIVSIIKDNTNFTDNNLLPGTSYSYRMFAYNSAGNSSYSNTLSATTDADTTSLLPTQPSSPSPTDGASDISTNNVILSWAQAARADSYNIYFGTSVRKLDLIASGITSNSFALPSLSSRSRYYWKVEAVNASGVTEGAVWKFRTRR